jgi:nicotinamide riboside kinase
MKVWCEYVFNKCHNYILEQLAERKYDLYLLCDIDLAWAEDPQREYPDEKPRQELYNMYKDILVNQKTPWVNIRGNYDERLAKAIAAVDALLLSQH